MRLLLFSLLLLSGCWGKTPDNAVLTEDWVGQPLVMQEIPAEGSRADIPSGVAPADVVAQVHTTEGGIVTIAENHDRTITERVTGKNKYKAYSNKQALEQAAQVRQETGKPMVTIPETPWWKWPLIVLLTIMGAMLLYFIRPVLAWIGTIFELATRWRK